MHARRIVVDRVAGFQGFSRVFYDDFHFAVQDVDELLSVVGRRLIGSGGMERNLSHFLPPYDGGREGWGWTSLTLPPRLNPPPPWGEEELFFGSIGV
jgi:hypothetical protein